MPFATTPSIAFTTGFTGTCALDDDIQLQFGSGTDYWFLYRSAGTAFEFKSTNVAGGGEDGIIFKVEDGTDDVDFTGDLAAVAVTFTGTSTLAAITCSTIVASGIIKTDNATEATSTTDGSLQTDGGLSVVKNSVLGGTLAVTGAVTTAALTASGILKTDDTTDATSGTDGSLQTDGGLSVVKDGFIGNDLDVVGRVVASTVTSLDNTGTPTVVAGNLFKTGGTADITDFDDGIVGQTIKVLSAHTVTVKDGAAVDLAGGSDYAMTATDTLTLTMYNNQVWVEDTRSVNGG